MPNFVLPIKLTLLGPLLTQSSTPGEPGLDATMARDRGDPDGMPVLAHSLVKGRLRQSFEELYSATEDQRFAPKLVEDLLGPDPRFASEISESNEPRRAQLEFTDFRASALPTSLSGKGLRYRVEIDPERGAASDHMLALQESLWASGEPAVFNGGVYLHAAQVPEAEEIGRLIRIGLRWTLALGAEHTIGFGRLIEVEVDPPKALAGDVGKPPKMGELNAESIDLVIVPQSPFCFAKHRREDNLFVSGTEIPGGAIKGCVAEMLNRMGALPPGPGKPLPKLAAHFDALVFAHAFPGIAGSRRRPVTVPLSVVKAGEGWHDLALLGAPGLVEGQAPAFAVDWKGDADITKAFGWPAAPARELRVRTAINRRALRAEDEMLFAQERVIPDGYEWLARVSFRGVPQAERESVARELGEVLAQGLLSLGKTKARAGVDMLPAGKVTSACPTISPPNGTWVLTLQTPALLGWPDDFPPEDPRHGAVYAEVWRLISDETLRLKHFYARQFMAGGGYLRHRFQKHRPYNPWLLTSAGSVFVLEAVGDPAAGPAMIFEWERTGLPLPKWARTAWGLSGDPARDWRLCPYLPENGYGEIAVNLACHTERTPAHFDRIIP